MPTFRFDHPELLWLLLLAAPIIWLGMRSLAQLEPARRWTAIGLRLAVLTLLVLMLAGLQTVRTHSELTVVAVVDQSESVRRFGRPPDPRDNDPAIGRGIDAWLSQWLKRSAADRRQEDQFGMVTYDDRPTVRAMPSQAITLDPGAIDQPRPGTDTASALRAGMALFPADTGARLLLVSDGNETSTGGEADVLAAAREAAAARIPIDVLPINYQVGSEVMVEALYAPTQAREGQNVALRVVLRATEPSTGQLQLLHDDVPVDLNGDRPGTGAAIGADQWTIEQDADGPAAGGRYLLVRSIDLPMGYSGANSFTAIFEPSGEAGAAAPGSPNASGGDQVAINNRAQAFTLVQGKGRILFVDNVGGDSGMILPRALAARGIELDITPASGLPASLTQLQRYDAVVLQNVPADQVTPPQQKMLASYVNNMGGGFVMVGGPDSFGAGGWTNSPIDRILPVDCEIPSQTILPSGALVVVLDRSGSMSAPVAGSSHSQQEVANEAAVLAIQTLYPQDMVGVVAFDTSAQWIAPLQMNQNPGKVVHDVRSIQPGGGTNIYSGLELAFQDLANLTMRDAAIRHIILLTDGASTPPPGGSYVKLVGDLARAGITLSTIGVGDGHNSSLLQQIAQMSGGQYHPVVNPNNLPQVFIKEAKTIRKNLIKEQPFVPQLVRTGSPILANVPAVPELQGLVLTGPKDDPRVFMPILGPEGEPVFAHWQVGLGRSAAFTSDATNRWAVDWLQWGGYADFWARTMRLIARPAASRDADLIASIQGDRLHVELDVMTMTQAQAGGRPGASFANFLNVRGSVLKPDGTMQSIELEQVGPGIYQADADAAQTGNYIVSLVIEGEDGQRRTVFGGASRPPGAELRRFDSNLPLLRQVAEITGGRLLDPAATEPAGLFDRSIPFESRSIRPLWRTLLLWLVVLVLLDVACRRIAWDPVAIAGWLRQRVAQLGGAIRPREVRSEATLGALKSRRAQTQATTDAPSAEPAPVAAVAPTRKFEASADFTARTDFTEAVGGASESDTGRAPVIAAGKSDKAVEQAATTSRLLAAKRRTRSQMNRDS